MKIKIKNWNPEEIPDPKPAKIIYWYDPDIKMYTFQILDTKGNQIRNAEYAKRNNLKAIKESLFKQYGIMPVKD